MFNGKELERAKQEAKEARKENEEVDRKLRQPSGRAGVKKAKEAITKRLAVGIPVENFSGTPGELVKKADIYGVSPASFQKPISIKRKS